jgi:hypothetical protein
MGIGWISIGFERAPASKSAQFQKKWETRRYEVAEGERALDQVVYDRIINPPASSN